MQNFNLSSIQVVEKTIAYISVEVEVVLVGIIYELYYIYEILWR